MSDAERIGRLERDIARVKEQQNKMALDVGTIVQAVRQHAEGGGDLGEGGGSPRPTDIVMDTMWLCEKCGVRLGIYDPLTGEMRFKIKGEILYVSGGTIRVPCRSCAHINVLEPTVDA